MHQVEAKLNRSRRCVGITTGFLARRDRTNKRRGPDIVHVIRWQLDPDQPAGEDRFACALSRKTTVEEFDEFAARSRRRRSIRTGNWPLEQLTYRAASYVYDKRP